MRVVDEAVHGSDVFDFVKCPRLGGDKETAEGNGDDESEALPRTKAAGNVVRTLVEGRTRVRRAVASFVRRVRGDCSGIAKVLPGGDDAE